MAEMRGDMPGNYFSWILRYPEQDAVIVVLRNGYGSTENFEQNLQAVLFGGEPRMPSKSAKDIAAQLWIAPESWMESHPAVIAVTAICATIAVWIVWRRRKIAT